MLCRSGNPFDKVSRKFVDWEMRKEGNPGVLFGAAMSLYKGEKTKVNFYHIYLKSMR